MQISGMSGNEIFCLSQKGFTPDEIVVGNSVFSLGMGGWLSSIGGNLAGGEVTAITSLISEGRHAAIHRMQEEAKKHGVVGVTGVTSEVRSLAGYTEFLAMGTGVRHATGAPFFTTSASGIDLYCHLDAGYQPIRFVMGNIAYSLGIGRGLTSSLRQLARGVVTEFSQMYNEIRHTALTRIRQEAAAAGGNAVVDLSLSTLFHASTGTHELIVIGTAANHPKLPPSRQDADLVVTSELTGEELWNTAKMGYSPVSLVTATSIYSLGVVGSIGAMFKSMSRGELPEVTSLVYDAREHCLDELRREATRFGAERVIGNNLIIHELQPGLLEIFAIGTAIKRMEGIEPQTPALIPQAVITDRETFTGMGSGISRPGEKTATRAVSGGANVNPLGCLIGLGCSVLAGLIAILAAIFGHH